MTLFSKPSCERHRSDKNTAHGILGQLPPARPTEEAAAIVPTRKIPRASQGDLFYHFQAPLPHGAVGTHQVFHALHGMHECLVGLVCHRRIDGRYIPLIRTSGREEVLRYHYGPRVFNVQAATYSRRSSRRSVTLYLELAALGR